MRSLGAKSSGFYTTVDKNSPKTPNFPDSFNELRMRQIVCKPFIAMFVSLCRYNNMNYSLFAVNSRLSVKTINSTFDVLSQNISFVRSPEHNAMSCYN